MIEVHTPTQSDYDVLFSHLKKQWYEWASKTEDNLYKAFEKTTIIEIDETNKVLKIWHLNNHPNTITMPQYFKLYEDLKHTEDLPLYKRL